MTESCSQSTRSLWQPGIYQDALDAIVDQEARLEAGAEEEGVVHMVAAVETVVKLDGVALKCFQLNYPEPSSRSLRVPRRVPRL